MRSSALFLACFAASFVLAGGDGASVAQSTSELMSVTSGTLPIVITAPHGGRDPIPGVPERRTGTRVRDEATDEIASAVALELEKALHAKPSLVVARFHRKYLDANRGEAEAFEDAHARPVYEAYHAAIRKLVGAARAVSGRAVLIDIHGQAKEPDALVRGTRDGKTVKRLLARAGEEALTGSKSIFGALAQAGYRVLPAVDAPARTKESRSYDGGFTVATYSEDPDGIDAIQIEIGAALRKDATKREKLEHDLAAAIATFYRSSLR